MANEKPSSKEPKDLNEQMNERKYTPKDAMPELSEEVKKEMEKRKEEEDIPENERKEKRTHILVLIPEEQFKNIPKIKKEIVDYSKNIKPKLWFHIITPVDIWNFYMDARYDLSTAIAMAFPLYDKGLLGALRVAEVHKTLVIRKFEKYVSSYVIAGSLVRGTATKNSDDQGF